MKHARLFLATLILALTAACGSDITAPASAPLHSEAPAPGQGMLGSGT